MGAPASPPARRVHCRHRGHGAGRADTGPGTDSPSLVSGCLPRAPSWRGPSGFSRPGAGRYAGRAQVVPRGAQYNHEELEAAGWTIVGGMKVLGMWINDLNSCEYAFQQMRAALWRTWWGNVHESGASFSTTLKAMDRLVWPVANFTILLFR